jgi:virulence-associated protein VagC
MAIHTKCFRNGGSTAVRIPAEFGIQPGEDLVLYQDEDGTVRISRAKPFASFFSAVERMRAAGSDPAHDPPLHVARMGPPRDLLS